MAEFDLAIIGSGPGGYVAAIRAAQNGLRVALMEEKHLGGICLNWGCIPTKALLKSAEVFQEAQKASSYGVVVESPRADFPAIIARSREVAQANRNGVAFLMKKNHVSVLEGRATLQGQTHEGSFCIRISHADAEQMLIATSVIFATGASPKQHPSYPLDGRFFLSYRHAISLTEQPQSLLIIGSGAIGLELAWFFQALGTAVTIIEALPQIHPSADAETSRFLTPALTKQGIRCFAGASLQHMQIRADQVCTTLLDAQGQVQELETQKVLFAIGMQPNTENLGLAESGIELDNKGFFIVDEQQRTSLPGIYAIGDCTGKMMLAHKASAEAEIAVATILGQAHPALDYTQIPSVLYCHPQVASIGIHEAQAKAAGIEYLIGRFPFQASGKARATGHTEGFIKLLFAKDSGILLGAQILGGEAAEMIATLDLALHQKMNWQQLSEIVFAHPTFSEAFAEAALASQKKALHL